MPHFGQLVGNSRMKGFYIMVVKLIFKGGAVKAVTTVNKLQLILM